MEIKLDTFIYIDKEARNITKLFNETQIKVTFLTGNTIENIVKLHPQRDG
jgi:hypothetical protein